MRIKVILMLAMLSACSSAQTATRDSTAGEYIISSGETADWTFACNWPRERSASAAGTDAIGKYEQTTIHTRSDGVPLTEAIRRYQDRPVVLFTVTYEAAAPKPVAVFPDFDHLPETFHIMSFGESAFAPPQFKAADSGSPWLIFDDADNAFIISPASHFLIQQVSADAHGHVVGKLRDAVANIPAGFTQQTLVAYGHGINHTWNEWGRALTDLEGVTRPTNEADTGLKYLGYWTDNGTYYYYNYNRNLGYGGTLIELAKHFRDERIPVRYMQLDSWWYYKTLTGPDGKVGKTKNSKLPAGEWNRYGGLLEYRAHPAVFPDGLEVFQRELGLPLITHNRWIDPASPYCQKYKVSGYAALDPAFWNEIITYISSAGVETYEQDWLSEIYKHSPELAENVDAGDEFADGMAKASAANKLTMQYCMALPCFFLQGSTYPNLTTIRCSDDRLKRDRWHNFLYTSRFASALGIWPWTDPYQSSETGNILLSDLSAGMVGFGDPMGDEDQTNIFRAVRRDGVIVKPDVPIVPLDSAYIAEANKERHALVASTYTDDDGLRTEYVLAFRVPGPQRRNAKSPPEDLKAPEQITPAEPEEITHFQISPDDLGITHPAYAYDFFTHDVHKFRPGNDLVLPLGKDGFSYLLISQPGASGIAFFGDEGKFVSNGKQRIASIKQTSDTLTADVIFAAGETSVRLHGCCESPVEATTNGQTLNVSYDPPSRHFSVDVDAKWLEGMPVEADGTRRLSVTLRKI
jgi:hypothetical protein